MSIKIKFTVYNLFLVLLLVGGTYFTIGALRADKLNLNPLFAAVCFVLALLLFSIRLLIRISLKDLKKVKIAEAILFTIGFLIFSFFCVILLEMLGLLS